MPKKRKNKAIDNEIYKLTCLSYIDKYNKPEEWKRIIIDDIPSKCAISNYGRIVDLEKGESTPIYKHRGHYSTCIPLENGEYKRIGLYRLVAIMFIPIPEKYINEGYTYHDLVVDHIRDGDEDNFDDNTMWNLQWLTYRENTSKAAKCGYREAFPKGFRERLDKMILDGFDNNYIFNVCLEEYGIDKKEIKATLQVRRRRLGVILKEHHEHDKKFVKRVDKLIQQNLSNIEILEVLGMEPDKRTIRLIRYRRSILKKPSDLSKYFDENTNNKINDLISKGIKAEEIMDSIDLSKFSEDDRKKIQLTIRSRISLYKKKLENNDTSSTTRES